MVRRSNVRRMPRNLDKIEATPAQRKRLTRYIDARRAELRLTWVQIAKGSALSVSLIRQVRNVPTSPLHVWVLEALEDALGWRRRSGLAILGGGKPTLSLNAERRLEAQDRRERDRGRVSDGDVLARWSTRLPESDYWDLFADFQAIRNNAMEQARAALLSELGIEHDPRDRPAIEQARRAEHGEDTIPRIG